MSADLAHTLVVAERYRKRASSIRSTKATGYDHLRAANDEALAGMLEALVAEVEGLREAAHVGVELENHHNAWLCPYCIHPTEIDMPALSPTGSGSPASSTPDLGITEPKAKD